MERIILKTAFTKILFLALVVLNILAIENGYASEADVGLVTYLKGKAVYWNTDGQESPTKVELFMKIRNGDHVMIDKESLIQLLFRDNGRQETWRGPVTIVINTTESTPLGKTFTPPQVETLPLEVSTHLVSSSLPLPRSRVTSGGDLKLRGFCETGTLPEEDIKAIKAAERTYLRLRKKKGADDLCPELYFISILADYQQFGKINKIINGLLTDHPNKPILIELKKWNDACLNRVK